MKKGMQHRGTRQEGWLELGAERGVHVSIGFRHGGTRDIRKKERQGRHATVKEGQCKTDQDKTIDQNAEPGWRVQINCQTATRIEEAREDGGGWMDGCMDGWTEKQCMAARARLC
jgi:hypothetical protein